MLTRTLLIGALALSSGCSLVLVDGPPDFISPGDPMPAEACTVERIFPLLDAAGAGAFAVTALTSDEGNHVRFGAVLGAALGYSSYTGFRKVGQCRERVFEGGNRALPVATEEAAWTEGAAWTTGEALPWTIPAIPSIPSIPLIPQPSPPNPDSR